MTDTDSAIKYVGVDGCKAGWIGVGLDDEGRARVSVREKFSEILERFGDASLIIVDMPIGLPENGKPSLRDCDRQARYLLGDRWGSVFAVPSREFINEVMGNQDWGYLNDTEMKYQEKYRKANEWSKKHMGGGISAQSFGITRKIYQADEALKRRDTDDSPKVREAHPEVCFMALNEGNHPMCYHKSEPDGHKERIETLCHCGLNVAVIHEQARREEHRKTRVADDDILDAIALAITAKLGSENGGRLMYLPKFLSPAKFLRLPDMDSPPTDCEGLPMEMVYAIPNNTESASRSAK